MGNKRGRTTRWTKPRKQQMRPGTTTNAATAPIVTDGDVQWAAVQVDEAVERLKAAEQAMLDAQKELADRTLLATKLSQAKALSVSASQTAKVLEQCAREAEQRQNDAALAKEQAREATKRKQEVSDTLKAVRAREQEVITAVDELQRALSRDSSETSETD